MSVRAAPQVGFSLDYVFWIFLRISGLFMWIFVILGIAGAFWLEARTYFQTGGFVDIGALARKDIETLLGSKVFLDLWVKVKKDWRNRDNVLKGFGFE